LAKTPKTNLELEDAIVRTQRLCAEQANSFATRLFRLIEEFEKLKEGKHINLEKNILIERLNKCVDQVNICSSMNAKLEAKIDKIARKVAMNLGCTVEELMSADPVSSNKDK
jgi:hypothetical protein